MTNPAGYGLQRTYHLIAGAGDIRIAAQLGAGESREPEDTVLNSVHPDPLEPSYGRDPTTFKWCCALGRDDESTTRGEKPDRFVRLDLIDLNFDPQLRWARFGAAVYLAGALVQTFDGKQLVEAGWTQYPETYAYQSTNDAGGDMDPEQNRRYRVYACWRNDAGELFRSPAITTPAAEVDVGDNALTINWSEVPYSNKPQSEIYYELYGTVNDGTTFYLIDRVASTGAGTGVSYLDVTSDATLDGSGGTATRLIDPHNPAIAQPVELEEIAPLGCEIIIAHGDRLWFSGGAIDEGAVAFSKQREVGEGLGWNDLAGTLIVDVSGETTRSLGSMNEALVVFQRSNILVQPGSGPDNLGNGGFPPPSKLAAADGAVSHDGTALCDPGTVFWSEGGPRLLTTGWQVVHIGALVEPLAKTLTPTGVIAMPGLREVRWYTADGRALLWDFTPSKEADTGRWAVWNGLPTGGAALVKDRPALVRPDGDVMFEDPLLTDDGGAHFTLNFATWEIRSSELVLGNNHFIKVGLLGKGYGPHLLHVWVYHDGAQMWSEYFTWAPTIDLMMGAVGDNDVPCSSLTDPISDGVYRFVRMIRRRPGATLRLRFSDGGAHVNTFEPHEVALEIGVLNGLYPVPNRTFPTVLPEDFTQTIANLPATWFDGWFGKSA